jgi:NAD(P)H-dependent FMN reductase
MSPSERPIVHLLVLSASLRTDSLNTRLAAMVAAYAGSRGAKVDLAPFSAFDCPSYDGDREAAEGIPPGAAELKKRLDASDAFVIVSPEYNASMPGVLKNVIDWTSRFRPQPFDSKHAMLLSASPSMAGGNRGLWSLRVPLEHLGARVFPDMFSLSMAHKALVDGKLSDPTLQQRFERNVDAFLELAEAARYYPCVKHAWVEFLGEPPNLGADRVDTKA